MDKPLHPATVHWPISFLSLAYGLDVLYGATTYLHLPYLSTLVPATSLLDISRASHYLNVLGLLTGLPAVVSGISQLKTMIDNGGMYEADGKTLRTKVKITFAHAAMNDVIVLASAWNWWTRRSETMLAPSGANVAVSAVLLPVLLYSAHLGGTLVYNYGTGLNIGKRAKVQ